MNKGNEATSLTRCSDQKVPKLHLEVLYAVHLQEVQTSGQVLDLPDVSVENPFDLPEFRVSDRSTQFSSSQTESGHDQSPSNESAMTYSLVTQTHSISTSDQILPSSDSNSNDGHSTYSRNSDALPLKSSHSNLAEATFSVTTADQDRARPNQESAHRKDPSISGQKTEQTTQDQHTLLDDANNKTLVNNIESSSSCKSAQDEKKLSELEQNQSAVIGAPNYVEICDSNEDINTSEPFQFVSSKCTEMNSEMINNLTPHSDPLIFDMVEFRENEDEEINYLEERVSTSSHSFVIPEHNFDKDQQDICTVGHSLQATTKNYMKPSNKGSTIASYENESSKQPNSSNLTRHGIMKYVFGTGFEILHVEIYLIKCRLCTTHRSFRELTQTQNHVIALILPPCPHLKFHPMTP